LLNHLPALVLRRLSVSADSAEMLPGVRGSRLLDRRPPHYRCPAVPGLKTSARAILMAPGSSVLPSGINHLPSGYCVLLGTASYPVARGSARASAASPPPVLRLLWLRTPLPNFLVRASAADAFTGVLLTACAAARQSVSARPCCLSGLREKL